MEVDKEMKKNTNKELHPKQDISKCRKMCNYKKRNRQNRE